ncbi:unnamed protein product [Musa hybrid cultivar]
MEEPHLRQIFAVGMVTQIGAYFFFASGVPGLGSSSAFAIPWPMAHAAAAAAASITARRPSRSPSPRASGLGWATSRFLAAAWATARPCPVRRLIEGRPGMLTAPPRKEAIMVSDAMAASPQCCSSGKLSGSVDRTLL